MQLHLLLDNFLFWNTLKFEFLNNSLHNSLLYSSKKNPIKSGHIPEKFQAHFSWWEPYYFLFRCLMMGWNYHAIKLKNSYKAIRHAALSGNRAAEIWLIGTHDLFSSSVKVENKTNLQFVSSLPKTLAKNMSDVSGTWWTIYVQPTELCHCFK